MVLYLRKGVVFVYCSRRGGADEEVSEQRSSILKVMFLAPVARPRLDADGECMFDGKIGMRPFVERVEAKRTSKNREKGMIETKVVPVNKNRYWEFMIEKVVPAIKAKWPDRNRNILIQQDGASSHIDEDDPEFVAIGVTGVWNIRLMTQSPKLPDLNVLDLSFFEPCHQNSGATDMLRQWMS